MQEWLCPFLCVEQLHDACPPGTETGALSVVDIIIILTLSAFISIILSLATLSNEVTLLAVILIQSTVSECYTWVWVIPLLFSLPVYAGCLGNVSAYFQTQNKWCVTLCTISSFILFLSFIHEFHNSPTCFLKERGIVFLVPSGQSGLQLNAYGIAQRWSSSFP